MHYRLKIFYREFIDNFFFHNQTNLKINANFLNGLKIFYREFIDNFFFTPKQI